MVSVLARAARWESIWKCYVYVDIRMVRAGQSSQYVRVHNMLCYVGGGALRNYLGALVGYKYGITVCDVLLQCFRVMALHFHTI